MCGNKARGSFMILDHIALIVSSEECLRFYEKLGFVSEGIRPGFYEKPVEDACIMWKR